MRVAFDVDGVLRNLMAVYAPLVGVDVSSIQTYDTPVELSGGHQQLIQILDEHHCWSTAPVYPELAEFCRTLSQQAEIVIVTSQVTMCAQRETLYWLHSHNIPWSEVHFCDDKLKVVYDAILEDKPAAAIAAAKAGRAAFLVNRPWTQSTPARRNLFVLPPDAEAGEVVLEVLASRRH